MPCQMLLPFLSEWLKAVTDDRTGFYTAQEDQGKPATAGTAPAKKAGASKRVSTAALSDQLAALTAQIQLLSARTEKLEDRQRPSAESAPEVRGAHLGKLPAVSASLANGGVGLHPVLSQKVASLVGPPPKQQQPRKSAVGSQQVPVPAFFEDDPVDPAQASQMVKEDGGLMSALTQQSTAITALVAHLTAQGSDALVDLTYGGPSSSTTKGVAKREKMQAELANGTSCFHMQMMQQLHRRLYPARPVPQTEEELSQLSVLTYMERQGGYKGNREMALVAWVLGHALDAAASNDFRRTKEIMSLLMVAIEQSVVDRGEWSLAFMLTLLEERSC